MPEQTGNGTVAIWGIEQPRALSPNLLENMVNLSMRDPG
jgi:hypothetical protein